MTMGRLISTILFFGDLAFLTWVGVWTIRAINRLEVQHAARMLKLDSLVNDLQLAVANEQVHKAVARQQRAAASVAAILHPGDEPLNPVNPVKEPD